MNLSLTFLLFQDIFWKKYRISRWLSFFWLLSIFLIFLFDFILSFLSYFDSMIHLIKVLWVKSKSFPRREAFFIYMFKLYKIYLSRKCYLNRLFAFSWLFIITFRLEGKQQYTPISVWNVFMLLLMWLIINFLTNIFKFDIICLIALAKCVIYR